MLLAKGAALSLILLIPACTSAPQPESISDAIGEISWVLESGSVDGTDLTMVEGFLVTLERTPTGIRGIACGAYSADFGQSGPLFASLVADAVGCIDPAETELSNLAFQALIAVTEFELDNNDLVLTTTDIELRFSPNE